MKENELKLITTGAELRATIAGTPAPRACTCPVGPCAGWESLAEYRWEGEHMTQVATLQDPDISEPTWEEKHVGGTRYESPNAPVAPAFFPYNRCGLWRCTRCDRHLLRYTEFGGYNVDPRIRELDAKRILDDV
ncbi:MAG: hypothetical protein Q7T87_04905 [Polaromonas sp.]|nr:hypothetical protein [Polaromonas sp.]